MEPGPKDCLAKGVSDVLQLNFLKLLTNDSMVKLWEERGSPHWARLKILARFSINGSARARESTILSPENHSSRSAMTWTR